MKQFDFQGAKLKERNSNKRFVVDAHRAFCFTRRAIQRKNLSGPCVLIAVLHCLQCLGVAQGQPLSPPRVSIQPLANRSVRVAWPNSAAGFVLEEASAANSTLWQAVGRTPIEQDNQFAVTVDASAGNRFFRLRLPLFTTIEETSPANGETGVAVIRETIVRFTAPLATNAVVGTNNFYAGFSGRRLLSRVELSSDRTKATLFYLEPLPGSTRVVAVFDGTALTDFLGRPLDADGDGQPGGSELIAFDTLSLTPLAGTAVVGRVFASELMPGADTGTNAVNRPLEGVTITVDGREQDLRTTTDAMGNFTLTPVPPGRFFVKIDGRTAKGSVYPSGAYYPYVGKAWDAVAGRTNNLAGGTGDIFLPLITAGTLQPVSMTQDITVDFPADVLASNPALAGVSITVPANSLFSDDGTRGGKVGIAPVPPDRLPGPLPPGLQPPIVITVQTDGPLNFDRPAPVCFPNLRDPVLGTPLPAGSQQELISFNHKKGIWEGVGSMTVSADGKFICTDPGVGILQPGWHGVAPKPDGPPPPPCGDEPEPPIAVALAGPSSASPSLSSVSTVSRLLEATALAPQTIGLLNEAKCKAKCEVEAKECRESAQLNFTLAMKSCLLVYNGTCPQLDELFNEFNLELAGCAGAETGCLEACKVPPPKKKGPKACLPKPPSPKAALAAQNNFGPQGLNLDPIEQQIFQILDQILTLASPYSFPPRSWPAQVEKQVMDLWSQANIVAGGDAAAYLRNQALQREIEEVANGQFDEPDGNAPPYPVLYVAEIQRPNGELLLRGQTEAYGQYQLFVPRDGILLSVQFYDPQTKSYGTVYPRLRPEATWRLPSFTLYPLDDMVQDSDHDGLADVVEKVYGTDRLNPDTDGDGVPDGAEVENGTNPLDGLPAQTGILATTKTPGNAVDICTANDLAIVAELDKGVSIFNIFSGLNPTLIAQVDTAGSALRVACSGTFVAVADERAGLAVIDISDPSKAHVVYQLGLESGAVAVATEGRIAHVLTKAGQVVSVDMATGVILGEATLPLTTGPMADLVVSGDYLYALTTSGLHALSQSGGNLKLVASVNSSTSLEYLRLFAGGGFLYATRVRGYDTFSLADPALPKQVNAGASQQIFWRHIAANGSGLGLAAVDGDVLLYDLHDPTTNGIFLTSFPTPGTALAVSIFNGLAYVADDFAGLQVINYLAYDSKGVPPTVSLSANFPLNPAQVESGARVRVTANAVDDVQVRDVEFYLDGVKVDADGNFPFEFYFAAPRLAVGKTSFKVRAKAIDTGGNATWSGELTVSLLPDTTLPTVALITPRKLAGAINSVSALFDELMDPASLTPTALQLFVAGPDGVPGTADDVLVTGGNLSIALQNGVNAAVLTFGGNLPLGVYRAVVGREAADRAGNHLAAVVTSDFRVLEGIFWINPGGGDWSEPHSWSTGSVPGPLDTVVIATPIPALVTHSHGTDSIGNLITANPFLLSGGTLEVNGTVQAEDRFEIFSGTLAHARLVVGGAVSSIRVAATSIPPPILDGVTLDADMTLADDGFVNVINGLTLNGTLAVAASLNRSAGLFFTGSQTLDGKGQVVFAGTEGNDFLRQSIGTLTIGPALTIRGGNGFIGGSSIGSSPLINQGTISADQAGQALTFIASAFTNEGTVEVKNGAGLTLGGSWTNTGVLRLNEGTLNLGGTFTTDGIGNLQRTGGTVIITGTLDNTGDTLTLNAGTGSWLLGAGGTLRGGNLTTSGGAALQLAPVGNTFATLDGLTLDTDVTLDNNAFVNVVNGLTVNGTLTIAALNGAGAGLDFQGTQTLGGKGQVVFGGAGANRLRPQSGTLTIGPALTIRGGNGPIGGSSIGNSPLINQGTISADVAGQALTFISSAFTNQGTVEVKNGAELTLSGSWTNTGVLRLNEGTLNLGGTFTTAGIGNLQRTGGKVNIIGVLDNTGDTLALDAGTGSWVLVQSGTIRGGNVRTSGGAALQTAPVGNSFGTLDGLTLDTDVTLEDIVYVNVVNGLTVNGTLTFAGLNGAGLDFLGTQTLGGRGQVVFAGPGQYRLLPRSGTLTIGPALTIHGANGTIGQSSLQLINEGIISADVAGGVITILGNPFTNNGTTQELNGGRIVIVP